MDAALDNTNVAKIANYIRSHASESFQFIVISLKGSLYERSNSLVGIYRDQDVNSSRTLTLNVSVIPLLLLTFSCSRCTVDPIRRINLPRVLSIDTLLLTYPTRSVFYVLHVVSVLLDPRYCHDCKYVAVIITITSTMCEMVKENM